MAEPDFALVGDGAGDAERLQTFADGFRCVRRFGAALLMAMAAPRVYAQPAFSNAMGCTPFTMS